MPTTTNYSWTLPTVGASEDAWGTDLNTVFTAVDTLLGGTNATEFAILDGATVTTAELNKLAGLATTAAELGYVGGVTSAIQTQLNSKQALDATLTALAGLATGANKVPYSTGTDTFGQLSLETTITDSDTSSPTSGAVVDYVATSNQVAHFQDKKTSGSGGSTRTASAWTASVLQTTILNEISGASLASNQVTLPAGTYEVRGAVSFRDAAKDAMVRLRNITDAATIILGPRSGNSGSGDGSVSSLNAKFTIAGSKVFELQYYQTASTLGPSATSNGDAEVYADIFIRKMA